MKNILMITPFFAPYSHAAVYRAHRFAKYLPRFGWKVYVLTVDKAFLFFIDNALLSDLPREVEIIRARYTPLTFTGFKTLFKKFEAPTSSEVSGELQNEKPNLIKCIKDRFAKEIIFIPDRYITWYPFAVKKAKELINSKHISAIYSTASPFTSHLIAMRLRAQLKIPWIADFRDPGVEEPRLGFSPNGLNYKVNCMIERKVMKSADLILTICEGGKNLFLSKYKGIVDDKIMCIKTGTDLEVLQEAKPKEKSKKFTIIFTGEFLQIYSRKFFELIKVIFERNLFERKNLEVLIVGSIKRSISLKKEIESFALLDVVRFTDFLSLKDYFSVLLSADATLFPIPFKNAMPIKLTDYLVIKKPIITFDANDEVRDMVKRSGLGVFVPDEIEEGIRVLLDLLKGNHKVNINSDYIDQFSAFNQTKEFSNILTRLTKKSI